MANSMAELEYECAFGQNLHSSPQYLSGWSSAEAGFTWTLGRSTEIMVPIEIHAAEYVLEIWCSPCVREHIHPRQRVIVRVNGIAVGSASVSGHTVLAWQVPGTIAGSGMTVKFELPDAVNVNEKFGVSDTRTLGLAFTKLRLFRLNEHSRPPVIEEPSEDHFGNFESLGDNCEFGLVQRANGIENLGLLRFSGQQTRFLVEAIDDRFARFSVDDALSAVDDPRSDEWAVYVNPYHMHYHAFIGKGDMSAEEFINKQRTRLRYLARKFIEDIDRGQKVFVFKRNAYLHDAEILPVFLALSRISQVNMLVVRPTTPAHPQGTVEIARPGLFYGYIERFGEYGTGGIPSMNGWKSICDQTLQMVVTG